MDIIKDSNLQCNFLHFLNLINNNIECVRKLMFQQNVNKILILPISF
jgi:hypothetical protein